MRTTLAIDDDVLAAARGLATRDRMSVGEVLSDLARKGLTPPAATASTRNGVPLMPVGPNAGRATLELVNQLRDETG
jgi:hypothetical protein